MSTLAHDFDVAADFERLIREDNPAPLIRHDEQTGAKISEQWIWHSPEGVELSLIREFDKATGTKSREMWFEDQIKFRRNGPSEQRFSTTTSKLIEDRWLKGSDWENPNGGPAHIFYDENSGNKLREVWVTGDKKHREDGPAEIEYDGETGVVVMESWIVNGKGHCLDAPALMFYNRITGEKEAGIWYVNGYLHNPTGGPDTMRWGAARFG